MKKNPKTLKTFFSVIMLLLVTLGVGFLIHGRVTGRFENVETLRAYIDSFGPAGPIILGAIQAIKVIVPLMPGFLGCLAGTGLFGAFESFLCNYIGLTVGSIVAFYLGRYYGVPLVKMLFSEAQYQKVTQWASGHKSFTVALMLCFLLPLLPDDIMCYLAGITGMSAKKFIVLTVFTKPWLILAYCLGFSIVF